MGKDRRVYFYNVTAKAYDSAGRATDTTIEPILNALKGKRIVPGHSNTSSLMVNGKIITARASGSNRNVYVGEYYSINDVRAFKSIIDDGGIDRIASLSVPSGHHVVDISHYVYFPKRKIIAIEFNHRALRHRYFANYLKDLAHSSTIHVDDIEFNLLMNQDSATRLASLGAITSVKFTVHSTQAQNMAAATRLTRLAKAQSELLQGEYDLTVRLQRSSKARGTSVPVTKDEVTALWSDAAEVLENLTVEAERPGSSGIERVNFLNDAFIANIPETPDESVAEFHARMVEYFQDYVEGVIWPT